MSSKQQLQQALTDIADAIRSKTGGGSLLSLDEMASEIEVIPSGGLYQVEQIPASSTAKTYTYTLESSIDSSKSVVFVFLSYVYGSSTITSSIVLVNGSVPDWKIFPCPSGDYAGDNAISSVSLSDTAITINLNSRKSYQVGVYIIAGSM